HVEARIAQIQSSRFGLVVDMPMGARGHFGSRLVLHQSVASEWPTQLRRKLWAEARKVNNLIGEWRARRNLLAAVLCSATGHRPADALGKITLGDVIPEHGLIVLQDKQIDTFRT